jgi:glycosyltransferase involved in cell wall biosynthesis
MVVHVPYTFFPDPSGGTEVYVQALAHEQRRRGMAALVAAPADRDSSYVHDGLRVRRFAINSSNTLDDLYGEGDVHAAHSFAKILDEERPHLVHLHAFTSAVSLRLVQECRKRSVPVVFSYHTPTVSCQRGTLLRFGTELCDGGLDVQRCSRCVLHHLGLDRFSSTVLGSVPRAVGVVIGRFGMSGGPWTALRMTDLIQRRHGAVRALLTGVDHCIALSQWVKDLLLHIGVPDQKITLSRQGLCHSLQGTHDCEKKEVRGREWRLRIAFLGRLDPVKGVHILIEALRSSPAVNVQMDIFGISQGTRDEEYARELKVAAAGDNRITFHRPISGGQVVPVLRTYDAVAIPSQWLETGPMVVLEAFAAGIPVIGSRLGGIEEQVRHEVDGLLVEPESVRAWAEVLRRVSGSPGLLERLRKGVLPPRTMTKAADEIEAVYAKVERSPRSAFLHEPAYANEHPKSK